jgi:membrane-bound serine protease (ClpP class)
MEMVVILLVVGAVLVLLETVLPGLIAGILGILCLMGAVLVGYQQYGVRTGNFLLLGVSGASVVVILLWLRYFPRSPMARLFISQQQVGDIRAEKPELLHRTGAALTQLRPSGMAVIDGKRIDVVTEGGLVERGTPVKVIAIEGMRVVVRPITNETTTQTQS